jgi:hypothetical protein
MGGIEDDFHSVIQLAKKGSFRKLASLTIPTPAFLDFFVSLSEENEAASTISPM